MGQLEQFHREMREFDRKYGPEDYYDRRLREKREAEEKREAKERKQQTREAHEQQRAANISQSWWDAIDQRIQQHILQSFSEGEEGWLREVIGQALGAIQGQLRKEFKTAIDGLRGELDAAKNQLQERLARLPIVKAWDANEISYLGDVVVHERATYQARKDTGKEPPHQDWVLLARAGRDGSTGRTPRLRGAFDAREKYQRFDIVEYDGSSLIALYDDPGIPGEDGWQLLAGRGGRGPEGPIGARGRKGERGARGEDAPTIIAWTLDPARYRAVPTMSNGRAGAPLDLRDLFQQFLNEGAIDAAVDEAMRDTARSRKLLSPL